MRVLITGICGFVGSTLARELIRQSPDLRIIGLDNLMRPGSELNRQGWSRWGVQLLHGDVRNPSDLEAVLRNHAAVADVAVVGVPSVAWGETPIAFVVRRESGEVGEDELMRWVNSRVGKTQRIARLRFVDELPRSAIGKILKRELRDAHVASREDPK